MDRQTFHLFTKLLVDPNESFVWALSAETTVQRPFASRAGRQLKFKRPQRSGTAATLPYLSWISLVPPNTVGRRGCVTFGVVVRAPVPNIRMSDPFPCRSWPYHSVPDGERGIHSV